MPDLEAIIEQHVRGNDLDVICTISIVPVGQTLAEAWLRVNALPTTPATQLFQKHITPTLVAGEGQIEDTGAVDGVAICRFEITATNSLLFVPSAAAIPLEAPTLFPYGIQVKTDAGKIYEYERGVIEVFEQIVIAA